MLFKDKVNHLTYNSAVLMDPEIPNDRMEMVTDLPPSPLPADTHDPMEVTRISILPTPDAPITLPLASGSASEHASTDDDTSSSSDETDQPTLTIRPTSSRVIRNSVAPLIVSGPARLSLDNHTQVQSAVDIPETMPTLILYSGSALDSVQVSSRSLNIRFK